MAHPTCMDCSCAWPVVGSTVQQFTPAKREWRHCAPLQCRAVQEAEGQSVSAACRHLAIACMHRLLEMACAASCRSHATDLAQALLNRGRVAGGDPRILTILALKTLLKSVFVCRQQGAVDVAPEHVPLATSMLRFFDCMAGSSTPSCTLQSAAVGALRSNNTAPAVLGNQASLLPPLSRPLVSKSPQLLQVRLHLLM
jgi:hypothetical protein